MRTKPTGAFCPSRSSALCSQTQQQPQRAASSPANRVPVRRPPPAPPPVLPPAAVAACLLDGVSAELRVALRRGFEALFVPGPVQTEAPPADSAHTKP